MRRVYWFPRKNDLRAAVGRVAVCVWSEEMMGVVDQEVSGWTGIFVLFVLAW